MEHLMYKKVSLTRIIDRLITDALWQSWQSSGDGGHFERRRKREGYANIPEHLKPGRMIMDLNEEDRKVLARAKAEDFNHRVFK